MEIMEIILMLIWSVMEGALFIVSLPFLGKKLRNKRWNHGIILSMYQKV